ncbi:hypothetical protein ACX1C1_01135 [Paenibacillus sp. strain BS8-2]
MMFRKVSVALATTLLLASAYGLTSHAAAEGPEHIQHVDGERGHHKGEMSRTEFEAYRLTKLREMAAYFGLQTEGKSADQLKQELKEARKTNPEKWEAFKAEHQAKRLERLQEIAKEHGIETEGKSVEQLHAELRKAGGDQWPGRGKDKGKDSRQEPTPSATVAPAPNPAPTVMPTEAPTAAPTVAPKPDVKPDSKDDASKGSSDTGKGNVGSTQSKQSK